jgi:hypothetical protein
MIIIINPTCDVVEKVLRDYESPPPHPYCKIRFETEQNGSERSGTDTQHAVQSVSTRFLLNYEAKRWSKAKFFYCGDPAISHDSHHVSLVQWTNLFASRHKGPRFKSPGGTYVKPGYSC